MINTDNVKYYPCNNRIEFYDFTSTHFENKLNLSLTQYPRILRFINSF